jgi:hypothetical protein
MEEGSGALVLDQMAMTQPAKGYASSNINHQSKSDNQRMELVLDASWNKWRGGAIAKRSSEQAKRHYGLPIATRCSSRRTCMMGGNSTRGRQSSGVVRVGVEQRRFCFQLRRHRGSPPVAV